MGGWERSIGCACCILGSTVMVIHSLRESDIHNMEELRLKMAEPGKMSKGRVGGLGKIGCAWCILGFTVMVIHSPRESDIHNMEELRLKMAEPGTTLIVYIAPVPKDIKLCFMLNSAEHEI